MRILHVAESAQGGVGSYLAEILPEQARLLGNRGVRVLLPDRHRAHVGGVDPRLIATWRRHGRSARAMLRLAAAVRREVATFRPTIIHAHSSFAGVVVRLLYGWRRSGVRIVYCPHGWAFDRPAGGAPIALSQWAERGLALGADRIVVISEHERQAALRIGIAGERLALVLNGIADEPRPQPARWDDDRLKLLFVGRLDAQKGFDTLLDAIEPLHDRVSLRVVGKAIVGPASRRDRAGKRTQVEYLGWRSRAEVSKEIAAADVVAVPSRWEGFGLVALEAMRSGRAVVATSVGGLREIVVDGVTGRLVPADKPERLMRALIDHDRPAWHVMGQAGRARYEALFTGARMNRELMSLYARIEDGAPRTTRIGAAEHA